MQAEQLMWEVPAQHTILNTRSALAFAKEWDKLTHVELCAALATLLPGPRLVWYLPCM